MPHMDYVCPTRKPRELELNLQCDFPVGHLMHVPQVLFAGGRGSEILRKDEDDDDVPSWFG